MAIDVEALRKRYSTGEAQEVEPAPSVGLNLDDIRARYQPAETPALPEMSPQPTQPADVGAIKERYAQPEEPPAPKPMLDEVLDQGLGEGERAMTDLRSGRFDPAGGGYDYASAEQAGITRDATGHYPSLSPLSDEQASALGLPTGSGLVLKGESHPTFNKTLEAEARMGNKIIKGNDGRLYSVPQKQQSIDERFNQQLRDVQEQLRTIPADAPERANLERRFERIMNIKETERQAGVEAGEAQATIERLAPIQRQVEATAGGLTFGISDVIFKKIRDEYGIDIGTSESTPEQLANSFGRLLGGVFTAQGLAQGMGALTKKIGLEGAKAAIATRLAVSGASSITNALSGLATGSRDLKEASLDVGQNLAAALVGFGAEQAVSSGVKNAITQIGADFAFDLGTDFWRGRLDNRSFMDWFIKDELPQLAVSSAFAMKDYTDADFEANRQKINQEMKDGFVKRFKKAQAEGKIDADVPPPKAEDVAPKTPEQDLADQLTLRLEEGRKAQQPITAVKDVNDDLRSKSIQELTKIAKAKGIDKSGTRTELADRIAAQTADEAELAPSRAIAQSKTAQDFNKGYDENIKNADAIRKEQDLSFAEKVITKLVDAQGAVKRMLVKKGAQDVVNRKILEKGASGEAKRLHEVGLKRVKDALGGESMDVLGRYLHARRTVDATELVRERGEELQTAKGIGEEESRAFLEDFERTTTPEQKAKIQQAAEEYYGFVREQLDVMHKEGLIGDEAYKSLIKNHRTYSPRLFIDRIDPERTGAGGERKTDSGIKSLDKGSERAMETDPTLLLAHVVSRNTSRLFRNRANKALLDYADSTDADASFVRRRKGGEKLRAGDGLITVFKDGQEVELVMPKKYADQWNGQDPAMRQDWANALQWASGVKPLKMLATGINPEFAVSNLARDMAYSWMNSGQYSNFAPKAFLQQVADYVGVTKDAWTRSGAAVDYIKEGGGMDFLTTQGMVKLDVLKPKDAKTALKRAIAKGRTTAEKLSNVLGYLGETSELMTRLAVRNRAIKNGVAPEEATMIARNMLDFSQGGEFTKGADNFVPYLNAAVQGTRGTMRAFKTDPKGTTIKAAQLIAMGVGFAQWASQVAPDLWDSISDREKATKWIIPLPKSWTKTDANGNKRRMYIAIPKDQFQQVFAAVGQAGVDLANGRPWGREVRNSILSLVPADTSAWPPIVSAPAAYFGDGYDFWTQEKVWQGADVSPNLEYTLTTPEMARDLSGLANKMGVEVSPERLARATSKVIPTSNPLASGLNSLYEIPFSEEEGSDMVKTMKNIPFLRRFVRFSRPTNPSPKMAQEAERLGIDVSGKVGEVVRREIEETKKATADIRQPMNVELDRFMRDSSPNSPKLRAWLRQNVKDVDERKRLWNRAKAKSPDKIKGSYSRRR